METDCPQCGQERGEDKMIHMFTRKRMHTRTRARARAHTHTHTHTHTHPFNGPLSGTTRGEPVPER